MLSPDGEDDRADGRDRNGQEHSGAALRRAGRPPDRRRRNRPRAPSPGQTDVGRDRRQLRRAVPAAQRSARSQEARRAGVRRFGGTSHPRPDHRRADRGRAAADASRPPAAPNRISLSSTFRCYSREPSDRARQGASGNPYDVEGVIVVYASEDQQIERQVARDGATREHALERMRAQMPIDEKRRRADWVIDNSGDLASTEQQVDALFRKLTRSLAGC